MAEIPPLPPKPKKPTDTHECNSTTGQCEFKKLESQKDIFINAGHDVEMNVTNDRKIIVGEKQSVEILGESLFHVGKDSTVYIDGKEEKFIHGNNVEKHYGETHEWFAGLKIDITAGILKETRLANHTEIKVGSHTEAKLAVHKSLEKVKELSKKSKLQELIHEHKEFTENAKKKWEKLDEKVKEKRVQADSSQYIGDKWEAKYGNKYLLEAAKLYYKADKLEEKAGSAKKSYDSCTIDCTGVLKLC